MRWECCHYLVGLATAYAKCLGDLHLFLDINSQISNPRPSEIRNTSEAGYDNQKVLYVVKFLNSKLRKYHCILNTNWLAGTHSGTSKIKFHYRQSLSPSRLAMEFTALSCGRSQCNCIKDKTNKMVSNVIRWLWNVMAFQVTVSSGFPHGTLVPVSSLT